MIIDKIYAIYFSPTGTTEKAAIAVTDSTGIPYEKIDLTTRHARHDFKHTFKKSELAIVGLPVYGGRLPGKLDNFFTGLHGNSSPAIALVVYGNRAYEDALIELKVRLEERGFTVIAGAAFIGEHTFSKKIAGGRPDAADIIIAKNLGKKAVKNMDKLMQGTLHVKGDYPYLKEGFNSRKPFGPLATFTNIVTTEDCTRCGLCAEECPWEAIDSEDYATIDYTKCMRCFRCIRVCPAEAKKNISEKFDEALPVFEKMVSARKEPELFLAE
ncbi:MAG: EFR1 family ferrodoxin [Dehalococcoidales bacterium]|nr:EFR1 family ferrodoxin [Dehalococcoidales bacterium]